MVARIGQSDGRGIGGKGGQEAGVAGVYILPFISIFILIKNCHFLADFIKKLGPFYKKIRCDKFGNLSISTKTALNNQIQSSMKIYMYIVC